MKSVHTFLAVSLLAALLPFLPTGRSRADTQHAFPGWMDQWDGEALRPLPLSEREKRFSAGFPGKVARFTDGRRQYVIRWVSRETRQLHPAADCFRGSGYAVRPTGMQIDEQSRRWGCFEAARPAEKLRVCEHIFDGSGNAWTDVSAWYWAAALENSDGPWWAVTIVERQP
jgi:hypothetical protein